MANLTPNAPAPDLPFFEDWTRDERSDLKSLNYSNLVVYSRDWTVETVLNQIDQGNIDLEPEFQRRNAWSDEKRSLLIESLIINIPVPEVVFAEDQQRRRAFIVIDGKQRLLTLAGFRAPEQFGYWRKPRLTGLNIRKELNGLTFADLANNAANADVLRSLLNADVRCSVISNYGDDGVLYDIFHRLNTGSVQLSTQELRQALIKGPFSQYIANLTRDYQPIHMVFGLAGPDPRMRDSELILRYFSFDRRADSYSGDVKDFLDESLKQFNTEWPRDSHPFDAAYETFNETIHKLVNVFQQPKRVGRKATKGEWESQFNKSVFEVEIFGFRSVSNDLLSPERNEAFREHFKSLCDQNDFRDSVEATTKTLKSFHTRYDRFNSIVEDVYGVRPTKPPFRAPN